MHHQLSRQIQACVLSHTFIAGEQRKQEALTGHTLNSKGLHLSVGRHIMFAGKSVGWGLGGDQGWTPGSNPAGINEEEDEQGGFHRPAAIAYCSCFSAVVQCSVLDEKGEWGDQGSAAASMLPSHEEEEEQGELHRRVSSDCSSAVTFLQQEEEEEEEEV